MRTTTILFAAIGLLLVGVAVTRTPGQQVGGVNGACCLPTGGCVGATEMGCTSLGGTFLGDFTDCIGSTCPSVAPPTVVGVTMFSTGMDPATDTFRIVRGWSDGQVDAFWVTFQTDGCGVQSMCDPTVLVPGSCTSDIDGNGDTGITDFLTLLGNWGPCP